VTVSPPPPPSPGKTTNANAEHVPVITHIQWQKTSKYQLAREQLQQLQQQQQHQPPIARLGPIVTPATAATPTAPTAATQAPTPITQAPTPGLPPLLPPPLSPFVLRDMKQNRGKLRPPEPVGGHYGHSENDEDAATAAAPAAGTAAAFKVGAIVQMADGTVGEVVGGPDVNGYFDVDVYNGEWEL
jgi:hypothetical protein